MAEFNKGDVVQLKSGGPRMTVEETGDYTMARGISDGVACVWFEKNEQKREIFDKATLEHDDA